MHFSKFCYSPTKARKQTLKLVVVLWKPTFRLTQMEKKEKGNTRTSQSVKVKLPQAKSATRSLRLPHEWQVE